MTSDPAEEFGPAWSPDGRTVAFLRRTSGNEVEVMAVPASGGPARLLAKFFYEPRSFAKFRTRFLAWRPGSRQLAVAGRNSPEEAHALWAIEDNGNQFRLTTPPAAVNTLGDLSPAYAPDGSGLLFTRGNTRFTSELYLLPLSNDGRPAGDPKVVTAGISSANTPVWISERRIVFHRFLYGGLWALSLPDSNPAPLAFARWSAEMPSFSAQGNRLIWAAGGPDHNIWSLELAAPDRAAGKPRRAVASTHREASQAVSPDGTKLAFGSTRSGSNQVWVSDLDGQNAVQITAMEGRICGEPQWSPNGEWIAFDSRKEGRSDVFAIRPDGSSLRQLTVHPADDLAVNWSRDGGWVYFSSNRAGQWDVWKTHWETGREARVTTGGGLGGTESPDGQYLYYTRPQPSSGYGFLRRRALRSGRDELVLEGFQVGYRGFAVLADRIYFISDDDSSGSQALFLLQLASGAVTRIAGLGEGFIAWPDITPDHKRIFYTAAEEKGYDLVAVENFR